MAYIISGSIFLIYFILLLFFGNEYFLFGFNYIIEFIFLCLNFAMDKPFQIPYYDYTNNQLIELKNGFYFNFLFFALFFCVALFFRAFNPDDSDKVVKSKKFIGLVVFVISSLLLIASGNNYSEYKRQTVFTNMISSINYDESGYDLIIDNQLLLKKGFDLGFEFKEKDNAVILKDEYSVIKIFKLNISEYKDYETLLKKRYSYNLKELNIKNTKFKNKTAQAVEYFTNKDYNRDYILRSNEDFFIINFKSFNKKNIEEVEKYKNILISSVYFKED